MQLTDPRGLEVFRELARSVDVIVQNLRPGVVDRLGVGYGQVREFNRDIIYLSVSGFGQTGPYAQMGAYDNVIQTYSGLADAQSGPSGEPEFIRQTMADKLTAFAGAQADNSV